MYLTAEEPITTQSFVKQATLSTCAWPTYQLILLSDVISLLLAEVLGFWLSSHMPSPSSFPTFKVLIINLLMAIVALALFGVYPGIALNPIHELKKTFCAMTLVSLAFAAACSLNGKATLAVELALAIFGGLGALMVVLLRATVRAVFSHYPWWGVPAVMLTTHRGGSDVFKILSSNRAIGLRIVAILRDKEDWPVDPKISPQGILTGRLDLAPMLASSYNISHAIVALDSLSSSHVLPIIERYAGKYRHIHLMPDTGLLASLSVYAKDLGGLLSLELDQVLLHGFSQLFKRCFDGVFGLVLSVILSPLLLLIFLAVKFSSPGPVFFPSKRVGRNGEMFTAWKFRSMVSNGDSVLKEYLDGHPVQRELWNKHLKLRNDPRVTAIGRLLRRTSLDELPQLWNVLKGEMSLVGPRPILPNEIERYCGGLALYARVRPGVTGFWQISGRNDTSFEERRMFDEYYVRNWSPWLDLYILGRTVQTVLFARGSWV